MSMNEALIRELEQEAQTTRRVLERVPGDRLGWKPHDKSMSLGQLALHVATIPGGIAEAIRRSPMPVPEFKHPTPSSVTELVPALDKSIATAKDLLRSMDDTSFATLWRVVDGDREVLALPIAAVVRSIMLNHWYHHRGQLAVYLRQVGVLVPSIYGPSADENPFAARQVSAASV